MNLKKYESCSIFGTKQQTLNLQRSIRANDGGHGSIKNAVGSSMISSGRFYDSYGDDNDDDDVWCLCATRMVYRKIRLAGKLR